MRNIVLENNVLNNQYGNAIRLEKVSNVWLQGNRIEMARDADPKFHPFYEKLSENTFSQKEF